MTHSPKMNIEYINRIINNLQEDPRIFGPKYDGWPLWSILKWPIIKGITLKLISNKKESLLKRIISSSNVIFFQFINSQIARVDFISYINDNRSNKTPRVLLLVDGFFRFENNGTFLYPFGEGIIDSSQKKFDLVTIEYNNRVKRKKNIPHKLCIREDFTRFPGSLKYLLFGIKDAEIENAKTELLEVIRENLRNEHEIYCGILEVFQSKITNRLLYSFSIDRKKAKKLLVSLNPRTVILTAAYGSVTWVAACKELGIPVIEIQHGIISKGQSTYTLPKNFNKNKQNLLVPDQIFMWGQYWVDINLRENFWDQKSLFPYGYTRIDLAKKELLHKTTMNFINNSSNVMFLYTSIDLVRHEAINFFYDAIRKAISSNVKFKILVKLHPIENSEYKHYAKLEKEFPQYFRVYYHNEKSLYSHFLQVHVHLSVFSVTLLESIELGVPTAILNITGKEYFDDLIAKEIVKFIKSPEELIELARLISNDSNQWYEWKQKTKNLEHYFFASNAIDSYVNHLNNLVENNGVEL